MAETLGMLCDKLTIVNLKEYHADHKVRLASLNKKALNEPFFESIKNLSGN